MPVLLVVTVTNRLAEVEAPQRDQLLESQWRIGRAKQRQKGAGNGHDHFTTET
jgi:hypothetical protein